MILVKLINGENLLTVKFVVKGFGGVSVVGEFVVRVVVLILREFGV